MILLSTDRMHVISLKTPVCRKKVMIVEVKYRGVIVFYPSSVTLENAKLYADRVLDKHNDKLIRYLEISNINQEIIVKWSTHAQNIEQI